MEPFQRVSTAGVALVAILSAACLWEASGVGLSPLQPVSALAENLVPAGDDGSDRWPTEHSHNVWPIPAGVVVTNGPRSDRVVALVFDADMNPYMLELLKTGRVHSWYDRRIVQILERERVPATIFLTGLWTTAYPNDARALGHDPLFEIGDHTYDHAAFRIPCYGLPPAVNERAEITRAQQAIETTAGIEPRLLRFPGDCYKSEDVGLAGSLGLAVVRPDVAGSDSFVRSPGVVISSVLAQLRPGSIIGLHLQGAPNAPATASALLPIIRAVRARGLRFVTVSGLFRHPRGASGPRINLRGPSAAADRRI